MVKPRSESDLRDDEVENVIDYNLKIIGLDVVNFEIERKPDDGICCLVNIQPTARKTLERFKFPLGTWNFVN